MPNKDSSTYAGLMSRSYVKKEIDLAFSPEKPVIHTEAGSGEKNHSRNLTKKINFASSQHVSKNEIYIKSDSFENLGRAPGEQNVSDSTVSFGNRRQSDNNDEQRKLPHTGTMLSKKSKFSFGITDTELIDNRKLSKLKFQVVPSQQAIIDRTVDSFGLPVVDKVRKETAK